MTKRSIYLAASLMAVAALTHACASQSEWTFNAPGNDDYEINLLSAEPAPGTPLQSGSVVNFRIKTRYSMKVANSGRVMLVFQVGKGFVPGTTPQTIQSVSGAEGVVELTREVTVPVQGDELTLFVPLKPEGMSRTNGEIVIFYPIVPSAPRP